MNFRMVTIVSLFGLLSQQAFAQKDNGFYWMKIQAKTKQERTAISNSGVAIENVKEDYVIAYGDSSELQKIKKSFKLIASSDLNKELELANKDFPAKDAPYHNYTELTEAVKLLAQSNPTLVQLGSIGKSIEGREIWILRLGSRKVNPDQLPGMIFMGGHHAREHLSVEMPLMLAQFLVKKYNEGNTRITTLLDSRDIHIIPVVNPDGMEFDIADGNYKMWRKNRRRNSDGTFGVDLNRNYGFQWGTGGSSSSPSSDTFKGPQPFSEPETQAIRDYIDARPNLTTLLSFHTFSQLILYPWGHKYDGIENSRDKQVHEVMAQKMAEMNKYTPQQSSDLYIASGDTTDWSYGVHKMISFTFELDPANNGFGGGGFYPGASVIQPVFDKNIEPCLYLLEYSDNPYRVLNIGIGPIGPVGSIQF